MDQTSDRGVDVLQRRKSLLLDDDAVGKEKTLLLAADDDGAIDEVSHVSAPLLPPISADDEATVNRKEFD